MVTERDRLVKKIAELSADISSLKDRERLFGSAGKVGVDPLPGTIRALEEQLAKCKAELEALDAHRT